MSRRKRMMEDLDQDIRDFVERETQDNVDRGMPPEEARYAALRKFGNVTRVKEDTRAVWSFGWREQLLAGHPLRRTHGAQESGLRSGCRDHDGGRHRSHDGDFQHRLRRLAEAAPVS